MLDRFIRAAESAVAVGSAVLHIRRHVREFYETVDDLLAAIERGELWPDDETDKRREAGCAADCTKPIDHRGGCYESWT